MLAKLESLARTAEQVHLTPAAIHKQIKNIENEFGVVLYEKTGRSVHLTQAARVMVPYLEELLSQYDALVAALTEWKGLGRGLVRIGANPAAGSYLLPQLLKKFREICPRVAPVLDIGPSPSVLQSVASRSLDLALAHTEERIDDRLVRNLCWEYDVVLVTKMKGVPSGERLPELSRFPFIQLPGGNRLGDLVNRYNAAHGLQPQELMVVNNSHTIISMVRAGMGIAMLPMWAVSGEIGAGKLRVIRQVEPPLVTTIELVSTRGGHAPPGVQAFLDIARTYRWKHLRRRP